MKKPTEAEMVRHYGYHSTSTLDDEDEVICARCGKVLRTPGSGCYIWYRAQNQATRLRSTIELCDKCNDELRELKAITQE